MLNTKKLLKLVDKTKLVTVLLVNVKLLVNYLNDFESNIRY